MESKRSIIGLETNNSNINFGARSYQDQVLRWKSSVDVTWHELGSRSCRNNLESCCMNCNLGNHLVQCYTQMKKPPNRNILPYSSFYWDWILITNFSIFMCIDQNLCTFQRVAGEYFVFLIFFIFLYFKLQSERSTIAPMHDRVHIG